jgi:hypothetical protein
VTLIGGRAAHPRGAAPCINGGSSIQSRVGLARVRWRRCRIHGRRVCSRGGIGRTGVRGLAGVRRLANACAGHALDTARTADLDALDVNAPSVDAAKPRPAARVLTSLRHAVAVGADRSRTADDADAPHVLALPVVAGGARRARRPQTGGWRAPPVGAGLSRGALDALAQRGPAGVALPADLSGATSDGRAVGWIALAPGAALARRTGLGRAIAIDASPVHAGLSVGARPVAAGRRQALLPHTPLAGGAIDVRTALRRRVARAACSQEQHGRAHPSKALHECLPVHGGGRGGAGKSNASSVCRGQDALVRAHPW